MSLTSTDPILSPGDALVRSFTHRKWRAILVPVALLIYFVYVFFAFDIGGLIANIRPEHAQILLRDFRFYKTEVTRNNRADRMQVAIEGERRGTYPPEKIPGWVHADGQITRIDLPGGTQVTYLPQTRALLRIPDYGDITVQLDGRRVDLQLPRGKVLPDWISASRTRVSINGFGAGSGAWRFSMTRNQTQTFRYFAGWEMFFFTIDSPFFGKSFPQLVWLAFSGDRLVPGMSNIHAMVHDFWTNGMWHHKMVAGAMFETVLMAFLGTMGAGLIALPLAFLAARNFSALASIRLGLRRVFDFLRGVDGLIWTVILSRAFGPGPLTGTLAILLTDTGTFGKMFSESVENIDGRQVEGVGSTGANGLQRARFGVIPQLAPVISSQLLYQLEHNTRGATVIGAIVGGGIGLLLTQAIITQKDWEEVCYYVILIVLMVMAMDSISGWIRRRFIKG